MPSWSFTGVIWLVAPGVIPVLIFATRVFVGRLLGADEAVDPVGDGLELTALDKTCRPPIITPG